MSNQRVKLIHPDATHPIEVFSGFVGRLKSMGYVEFDESQVDDQPPADEPEPETDQQDEDN